MNETKEQDRSPEPKRPGVRGSSYRNEVALGLTILLTVLLVYFGVRFLEGENLFGGTYDLFVEFESAGGLTTGSSVRVSGVKVGEVAAVHLKEESRGVRVRMEIRDDAEIPEGSVATLGGIGALDNVSIEIEPGPEGKPLLKDGDTISGRRQGELLGQVDSALSDAQRTFRQAGSLVASTEQDLGIILDQMQTASGEAAHLMRDGRGRVKATLIDLQSAAADLNRFAVQMDSVAVNLDHVSGAGGDTLVVALNRINALMQRLDGVVRSLERGSSSLESVAARMDSSDGTFSRMMSDPSLYSRLDSAAMNLNEILFDFRNDPKKYLKHLELIDVF